MRALHLVRLAAANVGDLNLLCVVRITDMLCPYGSAV